MPSATSSPVDDGAMSEPRESPCSDLGNAQAFLRRYGVLARWVAAWRDWYAWNEERGVWAPDAGRVAYLAGRTVVELYDDAVRRLGEARTGWVQAQLEDPKASRQHEARQRLDRAEQWVKWLTKSQNDYHLRAMQVRAATLPGFQTHYDDFDQRPNLLVTPSGTVDLWTGNLRPNSHLDLLTKSTPIPYDPSARCPAWDAFLLRVMCGKRDLVDYLQRMAGYCLTGSTEEHFLGFFYGTGANGKSTFLTLLAEIAGEYYCQAPRGLLFTALFERHPTELARLHKRRLVICAEVEEGARLAEGKVKDLTGGDRISTRRMREDFWDFTPTHKLLIAGNHWFFVRGQDEGIWRRIHVVPWNLSLAPDEIDTTIIEKLRAELPGILAWCVRGARVWREAGLCEPAECTAIRDQFRSDSDLFSQFVGDVLTRDPAGRMACEEVYGAYLTWMQSQHHAVVLPSRSFSRRLREIGVTRTTVRHGAEVLAGWQGFRRATAEERASRRWGSETADPKA